MEKYLICALIGITYLTAIIVGILTIDTTSDIARQSHTELHYIVNPDLR